MSKEGTNGVSKLMNQLIAENGYANPDKTQEWREVDELYFSIAHSIVGVLTEVETVAQVFRLEPDLVSKETIVTINSLNSDLNKFSEDLVKIRNRHDGKTGFIDPSSDDMILCLGVYNDYVILSDRFKALTFPAMLSLTEAMMEISEKKKAQDPTVVTDVEIKPVNTSEPSLEDDKDKVNV
jgi:hypothetical protein